VYRGGHSFRRGRFRESEIQCFDDVGQYSSDRCPQFVLVVSRDDVPGGPVSRGGGQGGFVRLAVLLMEISLSQVERQYPARSLRRPERSTMAHLVKRGVGDHRPRHRANETKDHVGVRHMPLAKSLGVGEEQGFLQSIPE
jgi:hypothetical protein